MNTGTLQFIAVGVVLIMVVAVAVVWAGLLAGIGPDQYRQITPHQFTIALLTFFGGFIALAILIALS